MVTARFHFPEWIGPVNNCFAAIRGSLTGNRVLSFADLMGMIPLTPTPEGEQTLIGRGTMEVGGRILSNKADSGGKVEYTVPSNNTLWLTLADAVSVAVNLANGDVSLEDISGLGLQFCQANVFPGVPRDQVISRIAYKAGKEVAFMCASSRTDAIGFVLTADLRAV